MSHLARTALRPLGVTTAWITMFSLLGAHMAVFQAVARAQMLRDSSRDADMAEAVDKTCFETDITVVPEPSTVVLACSTVGLLGLRRRAARM